MHIIEKYFWIFCTFLVPLLYLVVATAFYVVFYSWKAEKYKDIKIQPAGITYPQFRRELTYSVISLMIFTVMGFGVFLIHHSGYSNVYFDISKYGIVYLFLSVVLMILFHDVYFYWTHRLLHQPGWYRKVHAVHHLSRNPSPFTSLSFHPVEGAIQAAVLPLMVIVIPSHPFALFLFLLYMVYKNVQGHAGFAFNTSAYRPGELNLLHTSSIHHNAHHKHGRGNYGLYLTIWDRIMKTLRKEV
ncbi:MAG: sterol desaturase family protein [Chitinophagaceae bacterium]